MSLKYRRDMLLNNVPAASCHDGESMWAGTQEGFDNPAGRTIITVLILIKAIFSWKKMAALY